MTLRADLNALTGFAIWLLLVLGCLGLIALALRFMWTGSLTRAGAMKANSERHQRQMRRYVLAVQGLVDAGGGECSLDTEIGLTADVLAADLTAVGTTAEVVERGYRLHVLPAQQGVTIRAIPTNRSKRHQRQHSNTTWKR